MLTLVFALEFFARSFAPKGFSCRKKFTAITCVFISAVLTAITCIPLKVNDNLQGEPCTNLLLQPISQHGLSGLGLAGMLIPIWVFILVVIWLNLENNADTPVEERISAMKIGTHTLLVAFQVVSLAVKGICLEKCIDINSRFWLYHILQLPLLTASTKQA